MNPKAFISYSHDSDSYKTWVRALTDRLIRDGIDATLDQYDLSLGQQNPHFMEQGVATNDYVVLLITKAYADKANSRKGGVGYETDLITGEIEVKGNRTKFIPVLVQIDFDELPRFLLGSNAVRIKNPSSFDDEYEQIYATLTGQRPRKPKVGKVRPLVSAASPAFDTLKMMATHGMDKFITVDFQTTIGSLSGRTLADLYKVYTQHRLKKVVPYGRDYPFIFTDANRKSNHPSIVFESPNYTPTTINQAVFDKLILTDNILQYAFLEMTSNSQLFFDSNFPTGSIMVFLEIINQTSAHFASSLDLDVTLQIESSDDAIYMPAHSLFHRSGGPADIYYFLDRLKSFNLHLDDLLLSKRYDIVNRILGCFVTHNNASPMPYLSISIGEFNLTHGKLFNDAGFF